MSRFLCPHCQTMHATTTYPNDLEGYFVNDWALSHAGNGDLEEFTGQYGQRATYCPTCGAVTLAEPPPERIAPGGPNSDSAQRLRQVIESLHEAFARVQGEFWHQHAGMAQADGLVLRVTVVIGPENGAVPWQTVHYDGVRTRRS